MPTCLSKPCVAPPQLAEDTDNTQDPTAGCVLVSLPRPQFPHKALSPERGPGPCLGFQSSESPQLGTGPDPDTVSKGESDRWVSFQYQACQGPTTG
jgi:hypothetical protein